MAANFVLQDVIAVLRFIPAGKRGRGGRYQLKLRCGHTATKNQSDVKTEEGALKLRVKCLDCSRPDVVNRLP